jgi:hypothetical protein
MMPQARIITALSLRTSIVSEFRKLGIRHLWLAITSSSFQWHMIFGIGNRNLFIGAIDPLPTNFRDVSGRKRIIIVKHNPAVMDRNQNIQLQPAAKARLPPSTGPMLGAIVSLMDVSRGWLQVGVQLTQKKPGWRKNLFPREMPHQQPRRRLLRQYLETLALNSLSGDPEVPEIAKAWSIRRPRSAEYDSDKAMAMLAAVYRLKITTYIGRRPSVSAASPANVGAIVATAR